MKTAAAERKEGSGGRRVGSGRKPTAKTYIDFSLAEKRKLFYSLVSPKDFEEIVKGYIKRAKTEAPCAEFMINHSIGKAPQAIELTGAGGGAIQIDI